MIRNYLNRKYYFWIISVISILGFSFLLNSLDSGSYNMDPESQKINDQVDSVDVAWIAVQLKDFDPQSQTLKARVWVTPPAKYAVALGSSVQVLYDTELIMDAAEINNHNPNGGNIWNSGDLLRSIDIELDATNELYDSRTQDKWFPFDRYSIPISGILSFRTSGAETETTDDDVWEKIPLRVSPYTASLSGWSAEFRYFEFEGDTILQSLDSKGIWGIDILLDRTALNKALLILLALIFISGGASMLFLFRSILLKQRPPTLSGLVWSASTAFTMIQTRTVIPGSPRVGVKFDLFIFYPALTMSFVSGSLMFYFWLTRESWSKE
jgi:hypothetical protein